jgi:hypothetical protein
LLMNLILCCNYKINSLEAISSDFASSYFLFTGQQ